MVCEIAPQKQQLKHIGEMLYVNNFRMGRQDKQQHPFEEGGGWSRRVGGNKKKKGKKYIDHTKSKFIRWACCCFWPTLRSMNRLLAQKHILYI